MDDNQRSFIERELRIQGNDSPTEEEIIAEYNAYVTSKLIKASNAQSRAVYDAAVSDGYNYNGVIYDCDEQFTTDLVKMVMLVTLQPEEPVYLMDIAGEVHTMTCENFKLFAAEIGYYAYTLRQQYWAALQ